MNMFLIVIEFMLAFYFFIGANHKLTKDKLNTSFNKNFTLVRAIFQLFFGALLFTMALRGVINERILFLIDKIS